MLTDEEDLEDAPRRWSPFSKVVAVLAIALILFSLFRMVIE